MLFNFFKKHENQSYINQHLSGFQNNFSSNQKKAIMCSLFLIANADKEFHNKEAVFFEQTAKLLGYKLTSNFLEEFLSFNKVELLQLLDSLDESQKDWYIVTAFGMVHADGRALEKEYQYFEVFLENMNITEERFEYVLKKAELINEKFFIENKSEIGKHQQIAQNMFDVCKQGASILGHEYKQLSDYGQFEVIIFNSLLAFIDIKKKYESLYQDISDSFFRLLNNEAKAINVQLDNDTLVELINSRYVFFNEEVQRLYSPQPSFPGGTFHVFYENPLTLNPVISSNLPEILIYYKVLTTMMNYIADDAGRL